MGLSLVFDDRPGAPGMSDMKIVSPSEDPSDRRRPARATSRSERRKLSDTARVTAALRPGQPVQHGGIRRRPGARSPIRERPDPKVTPRKKALRLIGFCADQEFIPNEFLRWTLEKKREGRNGDHDQDVCAEAVY